MDSALQDRRRLVAYALPMGVFLGLLAISAAIRKPAAAFWLQSPEYWVYPLQTLVCAALLWWFRSEYKFNPSPRLLVPIGIGLAVFALWISPQAVLGFAPRTIGFNPHVFDDQAPLYWTTVAMRFARLVVVVPLVEEIFWRGFLLRYLIDEKFDRVPFGSFSWMSFAVVTVAFCFAHSQQDWAAAAVTGALYNFVAYRTKSLLSCVVAHALTNLLLGCWIMKTGQWGFW